MKRPAVAGLAALVALAVWGAKWAARQDEKVNNAIAVMHDAQEGARVARGVASVALSTAERMDSVAKAYKDTSAKRLAAANTSKHLADSLNTEFEKLAAIAPPECAPALASARLTIATKDREAGLLRLSLADQTHRGDTLEKALLGLKPATATLIAADAKLDTAGTKLADAVNPKWYTKIWQLRPKIGVGGAGGYDVHGKPNAVVGILFGWTF